MHVNNVYLLYNYICIAQEQIYIIYIYLVIIVTLEEGT